MRNLFRLEEIAAWPWPEAATILFGFAWGAMFGSFLNVVAHRLPRGESLARHRSRCPRCGAAILPSDNVPVIGWLRLRGRCRACDGAIAARYPLVEAGCGLITMLLAWAELVGGGRWLPRMAGGFPEGIDRMLRGDWSVVLACFLHAGVALVIVAWSLLDLAAWRPRSALAWVPIVGAVAIVAGMPAIGPGGVLPDGADWPPTQSGIQAVVAAVAGGAWGWLLGRAGTSGGVRFGLPLLGTVLGWQAVTVVAVVTATAWRAVAAFRSAPPGAAGLLLAAFGTLGLAFSGPLHARVSEVFTGVFPR